MFTFAALDVIMTNQDRLSQLVPKIRVFRCNQIFKSRTSHDMYRTHKNCSRKFWLVALEYQHLDKLSATLLRSVLDHHHHIVQSTAVMQRPFEYGKNQY